MGAGHASTSISYATGLAEAQRRSGRDDARVLCVIGDGALTGGMAYEGLNQAGALGSPITVVLNDNGMSISENVGALSKLFQRARVDPTLKRMREEVEKGLSRLPGGSELGGHIRDATKSLWFVPGALFEALGFAYLGPIDGHDISEVRRAAAQHARHGPPGRGPRQDGQGPRLRAGRGRRRGHARHHPLRRREREGRQEVARPAELHRGLRARAGGRGRARPARGRHHRRDAQGHGDAAHEGPVPRAHLRRGHRRAARRGVRLRAGHRRLPPGVRHLLDVPAARVRPDRARRGHPETCRWCSRSTAAAWWATTARPTTASSTWPTCGRSPGSRSWRPMDEAELVDMLHTALRLEGPVAIRYPRGGGPGRRRCRRGPGWSRSGGRRCWSPARRSPWWATATAPSSRARPPSGVAEALGARPTVVNARFASRSTRR